jgi:Predicted membrane protein (DUF2232)
MPVKNRVGQFIIISLLTTLLTASFLFMAPLGARYLHLSFNRLFYWSFATISSVALLVFFPQWALAQMSVFLLMGFYSELESQKVSRFYSALSAIAFSVLVVFFSLGLWSQSQKVALSTFLKKQIASTVMLSPQMKGLSSSLDATQIVSVMPAFLAFLFMILVFFGVLFVRAEGRRDKLSTFKIPDNVVWILIASLAGTFLLDVQKVFVLQKIAINILFVLSCFYYFQGLAVVGFFMNRARINYFLKVAIFFVLAFHLFAVVMAIGVADVWFNFRAKILKNYVKNNPYAGE